MGAALIGGAIMQPMRDLVQAMSPQLDMMEIACSPYSAMTAAFEDSGYQCQRINYRSGFDLESRKGALMGFLAVYEVSSLQNLTPRTELQWVAFRKRQQQDLRRADEVAEGLEGVIARGDDFA